MAACGDVAPRNTCYAGYHYNGGLCLPDDTCTDTTCNGHGACSQTGATPACACDYQYGGANCTECAAGFHDDGNGACTNGCPGSTLDCGRFGTCDDSTGTPTCTCSYGTSGATCDECAAPPVQIVMDTFGGPGSHHNVAVTPHVVVSALVPMLPVTSNGPQRAGDLTMSKIPYTPGAATYTLAFSRCPGDVTAFRDSEVYTFTDGSTAKPCGYSSTLTDMTLRWSETVFGFGVCKLPPGDGPWYANLRVDFDYPDDCQSTGMCAIDWQWN